MRNRWLTRSTVFSAAFSAAAIALAGGSAIALPPPVPTPDIRPTPRPGGEDRQLRSGLAEFQSTRFEFGEIVEDTKPTGYFVFTNTGPDDLVVYEVKPTCGCTLADLRRVTGPLDVTPSADGEVDLSNTQVVPPLGDAPARFAPGESGVIAITFDSHSRRGPQNRLTRVYSSDVARPVINLSMVGHVDPLVIIDPPIVNFGQLDKGEVVSEEIWVYGRTPDFEVPRVSSSDDAFDVEVLETVEKEYRGEKLRASRVRVTTKADTKVGTDTATLYIRTTDERRSMVTTTARGTVLGDLQAVPGLVRLGTLQVGEPFERQIRVVHRRGEPFRITGGTFSHPSVQAEITAEPVYAGNPIEYIVTVRGRALRPVSRLQGELEIATDVVGEETMRLRYSASIRAPRPAAAPATPND